MGVIRKHYQPKAFTTWIRNHFAKNFIFFAVSAALCLVSYRIRSYTVYICYGCVILQVVQIIGLYFERQGICYLANLGITVGNFANIVTAILMNHCYIKGTCWKCSSVIVNRKIKNNESMYANISHIYGCVLCSG